jgi:hypothetical protein
MMITAKVIADSISDQNIRLTTIQVRYPRMIHSELMTHRAFSRNGRSSRAVPVATLLKEEPYVPHFMKNQPGMVASEELSKEDLQHATQIWLDLVFQTKKTVEALNAMQVHKQWANRPLEWFGYIDVLISSTDWGNFFALRDEVGAQPEIDEVAKAVKVAMDGSVPKRLKAGEWHLPYIDIVKDNNLVLKYLEDSWVKQTGEHEDSMPLTPEDDEWLELLKKISVARCARLTIKPFDGDGSIEKELKRYELLMVSRPVHASPAEHVATPDEIKTKMRLDDMGNPVKVGNFWMNQTEHGNFYGWRQFRKSIPYNTVKDR